MFEGLQGMVTEIRFWMIALNERIVKENYKQPLALLFVQKNAIKVRIRKKQQEEKK